jgi:hypothetical protein
MAENFIERPPPHDQRVNGFRRVHMPAAGIDRQLATDKGTPQVRDSNMAKLLLPIAWIVESAAHFGA